MRSLTSADLNSSGIADNDDGGEAGVDAVETQDEIVRPITSPTKTGAGKADEVDIEPAKDEQDAPFEFMGDIPIDES